jgi:hypothetical protein
MIYALHILGISPAGIAGSNPIGDLDVSVFCECRMTWRGGHKVGLIIHTEESYRKWYVWMSVSVRKLWSTGGLSRHGGGVQCLARDRKACLAIPAGSSMFWIHNDVHVTYLADRHWFVVINYGWSIFLPNYNRLERRLNADVEYTQFEFQPQHFLHSLLCCDISVFPHTF